MLEGSCGWPSQKPGPVAATTPGWAEGALSLAWGSARRASPAAHRGVAQRVTRCLFPRSHEVGGHSAEAHHDLPELRAGAVQAHEVSAGARAGAGAARGRTPRRALGAPPPSSLLRARSPHGPASSSERGAQGPNADTGTGAECAAGLRAHARTCGLGRPRGGGCTAARQEHVPGNACGWAGVPASLSAYG